MLISLLLESLSWGSLVLHIKISFLSGDYIIGPYMSETGIPDMQSYIVLCFIFKLCEFTPLELYFYVWFCHENFATGPC